MNSYGNQPQSNPYQSYDQDFNQPLQAYGQQYQTGYNQGYQQVQGYGGNYNAGTDDVSFFNDIKLVRTMLDNYNVVVNQIRTTQTRLLNEVDEEREYRLGKEVDDLTAQASSQLADIKAKLQTLTNNAGPDASKKAQVEQVKQSFMDLIRAYQNVEASFKTKAKEQAITQYQVVDPSVTREQAEQAVMDAGGQQIFLQALLNSSMRGQAQSALNEVKARHKEILKVEQSMRELQRLFQDVENLVAEQDVYVEQVHQNTTEAREKIQEAVKHEEQAIESGKKARRKKCWCIWISIVIAIIIIAAIVGGIAGKFANKSN